MKGAKNHIYGLDLIRFLAALMVSVYHLGFRALGFTQLCPQ
ncbi:hypothetical protein SAMN02949497_0625 [Methylomagnum ishizawai]|uniref:Uncharacterized protein n=1 Tax=Methylomagnum ishizawai TaxID=1760988 RepID=A0A1Y6CSS1_9GAMM|nr:hypothetical protein SAMN02949497_0625 [Methylomagnum ishizawai]